MELTKAINTRRSIRRYLDKPVPENMLLDLVHAAMQAPSAGNQQPWHFVIVTEREKLDKIPAFHPFCKMVTKAPAAIVVCGDPEGRKWPQFWVQDCSAAIQNLLLAATDLGLGTVWTGVYPEEDRIDGTRRLFNIPGSVIPLAIIPIGWPEGEFKEMDRLNKERIHTNSW